MIFEKYELEEILKVLENDILANKIEQVLSSTKSGRFTLHCTLKSKPVDEITGELLKLEEEKNAK